MLPALSRATAVRLSGVLAATALAGALAGCQAEASSRVIGTAHAAAPSAAKGSFAGADGSTVVAGRALQAQGGRLTLDGVPYGTVDQRSVAQLLVRNGQPTVTVNGRARLPDAR